MSNFPENLLLKLKKREAEDALRCLAGDDNLVDFASNDYLGFATNDAIYAATFQLMLNKNSAHNGATGSRLISGNHSFYDDLEAYLTSFFNAEATLVFNSGYDANLGFFSAVPQRNDIVFYDEYIHASIRDGIRLSNAKSFKFEHNNLEDLKAKIQAQKKNSPKANLGEIYIVTESIFSMDGDSPDLKALSKLSHKEACRLVVDEAHAIGIFGKNGEGLVQHYKLQNKVFARIVTFGKALGCHGAAIIGSTNLKSYLVNFSRSFIFTTGLPPHSVATISSAFMHCVNHGQSDRNNLLEKIKYFKNKIVSLKLEDSFITGVSPIQSCIIAGNDRVKKIACNMQNKGFNVKAILSPTVPEGQERLRFCVHNFNSKEEIGLVLQLLATYIK